MGLFTHLLRFNRRAFLLAIGAGMASGAAGAAFIAVVNLALGRVGDVSGALVAAFVGLCLATVAARFLAQNLLFRLSQQVIRDLRRRLVDGVLSAPLRRAEKLGTARIHSALTDDVVVIADALPGLPLVCSSAAFLVVSLGYLAFISPPVALATVLTTLTGIVLHQLFARFGIRYLKGAREVQDRLFEHFKGVTEGVKELKLSRERRTVLAGRALDATAESYQRRSVLGLSVFEGAAGSGQAVFFGLIGCLLFVFPGAFALSAKDLSDSILVLLFTVSSLGGVLTWVPVLGRASVALGKIGERLAYLASAEGEDGTTPVGSADWERISFQGVSHTYPGPAGEEFSIGPVDFTFHRGDVLFVIGGNGSGKTTLAKVLTGLYPPQSGLIEIDGAPVTDANRAGYREHFSAVFSDFHLFDRLPGTPGPEQTRLATEYLRELQLDHKVSIVDGRFSTTALSQGQRKRLALVSAYLEDSSFYVFDEWAADQDPVFRQVFYTRVLADLKQRGKTVVVISHDDQYFHVADRLVRLDFGQIRQEMVPDAR